MSIEFLWSAQKDAFQAIRAYNTSLQNARIVKDSAEKSVLAIEQARNPLQRWIREKSKAIYMIRVEWALKDIKKKAAHANEMNRQLENAKYLFKILNY